MAEKIKILFHTDSVLGKTGFARNARALLSFLWATDKYEIVHYCTHVPEGNRDLLRTPWKSLGCYPNNPDLLQRMKQNPDDPFNRMVNYGTLNLDDVIKNEKPRYIYWNSKIFWAFNSYGKPWWNKIPCIIHTTLDSLPLFQPAIEQSKNIKHFWVWSNFAEKEFKKLGIMHPITRHGVIETKHFHRLENQQKKNLRQIHGIAENEFVIGFVFRNQSRKSVPNLLDGYRLFKQENAIALKGRKTSLLLHTCLSEANTDMSWDIVKLATDMKISLDEIRVTHICRQCKRYHIKPLSQANLKMGAGGAPAQELGTDCQFCGTKKAQVSTSVAYGVSEDELNEVYNIMDVYCHPFNSGGQEIPIQEAKCAELITLVTSYSCGEEMTENGAGSFALDWDNSWEIQTSFNKAVTKASSIAKQLKKVLHLPEKKRRDQERLGREWALKNFSIESIGKDYEDFFDKCGKTDYDFSMKTEEPNPNAIILPNVDNEEWVSSLYKKILKVDVDPKGLSDWTNWLADGTHTHKNVETYFRQQAQKTIDDKNQEKKMPFEDLLDKTENKRLLMVCPESIGDIFIVTALFQSAKEQYPDYDLYFGVKPEYFELLDGNPYVYKTLGFIDEMKSEIKMTGAGNETGYFDAYIYVPVATQIFLNYLTNDNIAHEVNA